MNEQPLPRLINGKSLFITSIMGEMLLQLVLLASGLSLVKRSNEIQGNLSKYHFEVLIYHPCHSSVLERTRLIFNPLRLHRIFNSRLQLDRVQGACRSSWKIVDHTMPLHSYFTNTFRGVKVTNESFQHERQEKISQSHYVH